MKTITFKQVLDFNRTLHVTDYPDSIRFHSFIGNEGLSDHYVYIAKDLLEPLIVFLQDCKEENDKKDRAKGGWDVSRI